VGCLQTLSLTRTFSFTSLPCFHARGSCPDLIEPRFSAEQCVCRRREHSRPTWCLMAGRRRADGASYFGGTSSVFNGSRWRLLYGEHVLRSITDSVGRPRSLEVRRAAARYPLVENRGVLSARCQIAHGGRDEPRRHCLFFAAIGDLLLPQRFLIAEYKGHLHCHGKIAAGRVCVSGWRPALAEVSPGIWRRIFGQTEARGFGETFSYGVRLRGRAVVRFTAK